MKNSGFIYLTLWLILLFGCEKSGQSETAVADNPLLAIKSPPFNTDSAYFFLQTQVDFGPRVPNSKAHASCAAYLSGKLASYADVVVTQDFEASNSDNGSLYKFQNIIGSFNPDATRRILLGAHWDTRLRADKDPVDPNQQFDGANDGGSGVAVLLEIARILSRNDVNLGVDIIFFDAEDQGGLGLDWCLGSRHWSNNKHRSNYSAYYGILLDMVGAKNATFRQEYYSLQYAPTILDKVWNEAHAAGFSRYFLYQKAGAVVDDHYFVNVNAKIPMIDIIDTKPDSQNEEDFFKDYHHRPQDNMDVIDKETLHAVGTTMVNLLFRESAQLAQQIQ